jgi:5'-nucleotidase
LAALDGPAEVRVVPMGVDPWGESFECRNDPRGRPYYWANGTQPAAPTSAESDLAELRAGHITLTPLDFDMTRRDKLAAMRRWQLGVEPAARQATA